MGPQALGLALGSLCPQVAHAETYPGRETAGLVPAAGAMPGVARRAGGGAHCSPGKHANGSGFSVAPVGRWEAHQPGTLGPVRCVSFTSSRCPAPRGTIRLLPSHGRWGVLGFKPASPGHACDGSWSAELETCPGAWGATLGLPTTGTVGGQRAPPGSAGWWLISASVLKEQLGSLCAPWVWRRARGEFQALPLRSILILIGKKS